MERSRSPGAQYRLGVDELEGRCRDLTLLLYDTKVDIYTLQERVYPYLAADIQFINPWATARGATQLQVATNGYHSIGHFDFQIFQLGIKLDDSGERGRALVDGVVRCQLPFYAYPLRLTLVYDLVMTDDGASFQITRLEELWSWGDLVENAPLVGRLYGAARQVAGYLLTRVLWLGWTCTGGVAAVRRPGRLARLPQRYPSQQTQTQPDLRWSGLSR